METVEVKVMWENKEETIVHGKINIGDQNDAINKSVVPVMRDGTFVNEINQVLKSEYEWAFSVKKAPFNLKNVDEVRNNLKKLSIDDGHKSFNNFRKLNYVIEKKSKSEECGGSTDSDSTRDGDNQVSN